MEPTRGQLAYVRYFDNRGRPYQEYHERLIIGRVRPREFLVRSPTRDYFVEELSRTNPDLADLHMRADGALPAGVPLHRVFGFGDLSAEELVGRGAARSLVPCAYEPALLGAGSPRILQFLSEVN
mmetsp:Transcript_90715/g.198830  ORF Transcript_90715/g.198830 Transcript_90715/m.198830 type:complete len:125 (-) Transcript_90715:233-607(-)